MEILENAKVNFHYHRRVIFKSQIFINLKLKNTLL
jgi:hypothetical protein